MTPELQRAALLRERGRHEEAVSFLLAHLANHPEDPWAFIELALNRLEIPGQLAQSLADAKTATGLMPSASYPLSLQARILCKLDKPKDALPLAESAIEIDPEDGHAWCSKCIALIGLSSWKEAEQCARTALSLDPDDEGASNLLAHTLRIQNRLDESEEESNRRLARNPENAFSFSTSGWTALQRGDIKGAEEKFKEALRIDPELDHAREGLKESFRARSAFFRVFMRWSFFLQKFSENHRTLIIISLLIGFRIARTMAAAVHPLLVVLVILVYYLFVFGSWLSNGLANFFLLRDPIARLSLERSEKVEGITIAFLFFGGLAMLLSGFLLAIPVLTVSGTTFLAAALPASLIFTNPSVKGTVVFSAISLAILACGVSLALAAPATTAAEPFAAFSSGAFTLMIFLCAGSTWLGMMPSLREKAPA